MTIREFSGSPICHAGLIAGVGRKTNEPGVRKRAFFDRMTLLSLAVTGRSRGLNLAKNSAELKRGRVAAGLSLPSMDHGHPDDANNLGLD